MVDLNKQEEESGKVSLQKHSFSSEHETGDLSVNIAQSNNKKITRPLILLGVVALIFVLGIIAWSNLGSDGPNNSDDLTIAESEYLPEDMTDEKDDYNSDSDVFVEDDANDDSLGDEDNNDTAVEETLLAEVSEDESENLANEAQSVSNDYIIADSNSRYIAAKDLEGLDDNTLRLARNEIYARKGRRFNDSALQNYFDGKSWYQGTIAPDDFKETMLNDYERKNAVYILNYENSR